MFKCLVLGGVGVAAYLAGKNHAKIKTKLDSLVAATKEKGNEVLDAAKKKGGEVLNEVQAKVAPKVEPAKKA